MNQARGDYQCHPIGTRVVSQISHHSAVVQIGRDKGWPWTNVFVKAMAKIWKNVAMIQTYPHPTLFHETLGKDKCLILKRMDCRTLPLSPAWSGVFPQEVAVRESF